jgi:hypothetical protein
LKLRHYHLVEHMALKCPRSEGTFTDPRLDALRAKTREDWKTLTENPHALVPIP